MDLDVSALLVLALSLQTCSGQLELGGMLDGMGDLALLSAGGGLGGPSQGIGGVGSGVNGANPGLGSLNAGLGGNAFGMSGTKSGIGSASSGIRGAGSAMDIRSNGFGGTSSVMGVADIGGGQTLNPVETRMLASLLDLDVGGLGVGGIMGGGIGGMTGGGTGAMISGGMGGMTGGGMGGGMIGQMEPMIQVVTTVGGELGPAGISRLIRTMITPMIAGNMIESKVNEVVKVVVGPHANPTPQMIGYARSQMKPPSSPKDLLAYMNMMLELAEKVGIFMPDGTIKKPAPEVKPGDWNATSPKAKTDPTLPTLDEVRDLIIKRSLMWFKSQKPPKTTKVGPTMSSGMMI